MKIATEKNVDDKVARGFGEEWSKFRQDETNLAQDERETIFQNYFRIFPWDLLPPGGGIGADIGCGTGRWAKMVAPRVAHLHLLDASPDALAVARENLENVTNVSFDVGTVGAIPLPDRSLDFAFSLGVLHHVPDTLGAVRAIAKSSSPAHPSSSSSITHSIIAPCGTGCSGRSATVFYCRFAAAPLDAKRHQRDHRRDDLLAACTRVGPVDALAHFEPLVSAVVVRGQIVLCHANRCL